MTTPLDFKALVVTHQNAVCAVAYAVLRDRARSEEVAQEAFLVAWQKLPGMDPQPSLPGWVCGIARNLARNAARRRKELPMTPATPEPIASTTALDRMIAAEASELAERALATLSDSEREAVVLYYRGEQSMADVAVALEITEAAAKKRVLRGREHVRAALEQIETALRGTRPGPAFTASCVAAAAGLGLAHTANANARATSGATSSAEVTARVNAKWIVGAAAVPIIGLGAWFALHRTASPDAPASPTAKLSQSTAVIATSALTRHIDPQAKHVLEARIGAARAQRIAIDPSTPPSPVSSDEDHADRVYDFSGSMLLDDPKPEEPRAIRKLDKRAIRDAVMSVQPLIRECYERTGKNELGTFELQFRLEGEPDVGTIASDAQIQGVPFETNRELVECLRETILSIEMPGLDVGGTTDVNYPFTIR